MRRLGIDQQMAEVYDSAGNYWRIVLPAPIVTGAFIDPPLPATRDTLRDRDWSMFREDHFDPVARIRRGRFYAAALGQRPSPQRVLPRNAGDIIGGHFEKSLFVYDEYHSYPPTAVPKLVALGTLDSFALWQVASPPERISTGELLFVLRARHNFGILPELDIFAVPEIGRAKITETLERLTDAAQRDSPSSIIDRARDAAQCTLATWAADKSADRNFLTYDLGQIIRQTEKEKRTAARAAEMVRVLHSNAKPNEQERWGSRPPMEDDAELAVKAVALIVRELGWELKDA
jgi:hypothetical protein